MNFPEIPDAKGSHNHNHYNHGHTSKHNPNEVYKSHKQQQQSQSNQRTPKVTHPSLVSDDDDNIFGSAEDYDDADLSPNIFLRPTKSSDGFGANANTNNNNNHHHYPYQNTHGNGNTNNNNARFNIPLFGGGGANGAAGNGVGTGINGNALNGNNAIVTRTGSSDNEVTSAAASTAKITAFTDGKQTKYYAMLFDHHFVVFTFNLLISVFVCLLAS